MVEKKETKVLQYMQQRAAEYRCGHTWVYLRWRPGNLRGVGITVFEGPVVFEGEVCVCCDGRGLPPNAKRNWGIRVELHSRIRGNVSKSLYTIHGEL